ncbi:MAG: cysteine desulfurase family protein [Fimbriimonadaceae bacterium]
MKRIYLDHAATSPVTPEVRNAMRPWLESEHGNPSSLYAEGRRARAAIDASREAVATRLGCEFAEVTFTSGGTEAANLAVVGTALAAREGRRRRVLVSAIEHHCVLHAAESLAAFGYRVDKVPVDAAGRLDLDALGEMLGDDVLLVSLMHANNEIGRIQPVAQAAAMARDRGVLFHMDAVQTLGVLPVGLDLLGVDLLSVSAHKLGGPKAVGALAVRAGVRVSPLIVGGGQERERRAGTEHVAGIVGFGEAVRAPINPDRGRSARDAFLTRLSEAPFAVTASGDDVLPGFAHGRFPGVPAETVLIALDRLGVAAGSGAACSSGSLEPSHVLLAMGLTPNEAKDGLRFTFGSQTTMDEAIEAAERVLAAWRMVTGVQC